MGVSLFTKIGKGPLGGALLLYGLFHCSGGLQCQSLKADAPAHLQRGVNEGTLDSGIGPHYWDVTVGPGAFRLVFSSAWPRQPFKAENPPVILISIAPEAAPDAVSQRRIPDGGTVFEGTVSAPTHVSIVLRPPKSLPERVTADYALVATGDVDY